MDDASKKIALLIMAKRDKGKAEKVTEDDDESPKLEDILREFKDSLEADDMAGAAEAFKAAIEFCEYGAESDDETDDDGV